LRWFAAFPYSTGQFGSVSLLYTYGRAMVRPIRGRLL
jgi:hypothetical protein